MPASSSTTRTEGVGCSSSNFFLFECFFSMSAEELKPCPEVEILDSAFLSCRKCCHQCLGFRLAMSTFWQNESLLLISTTLSHEKAVRLVLWRTLLRFDS